MEAKRQTEAQQVYAEVAPQPVSQVVTVNQPLQEMGNISTDGGMVLLREEGWKEVKMCVISEVELKPSVPVKPDTSPDIRILLQRHSYQAGIWDADDGTTPIFEA
jgi:hypothetical protein